MIRKTWMLRPMDVEAKNRPSYIIGTSVQEVLGTWRRERRGGPGDCMAGKGSWLDCKVGGLGRGCSGGSPENRIHAQDQHFSPYNFLPVATLCRQVHISQGTLRPWCQHKRVLMSKVLPAVVSVKSRLCSQTGPALSMPLYPSPFHFIPFYRIPYTALHQAPPVCSALCGGVCKRRSQSRGVDEPHAQGINTG